jgi:hypothetical protein
VEVFNTAGGLAEAAATEVSAPPKSLEPNCWDDPDGNMNVVVVDGDAGSKPQRIGHLQWLRGQEEDRRRGAAAQHTHYGAVHRDAGQPRAMRAS